MDILIPIKQYPRFRSSHSSLLNHTPEPSTADTMNPKPQSPKTRNTTPSNPKPYTQARIPNSRCLPFVKA